jgi:hypothetical protein
LWARGGAPLTRRKLLSINLVIACAVAVLLAIVAHEAHRPQPLVLTGSSFYWSINVTVRPGTVAHQALVEITPTYHGTGTANHISWKLVDARGNVLEQGTRTGPVPRGNSLGRQEYLIDSPPPNWSGTAFDVTWLEIRPDNPGGQGVTEEIPVGPNGATT